MSLIYKIEGSIEDKYQGAGIALAAVTGGRVVGLAYLRDVIDDLDESDLIAVKQALVDSRLGPIVRELQALGDVSVGMCSCYEFIEL